MSFFLGAGAEHQHLRAGRAPSSIDYEHASSPRLPRPGSICERVTARQRQTKLDQAREWMLLLGRKTAEERVATLLLFCAEKMQKDGCAADMDLTGLRVELPLSRTEMAEFLGLTLETVSRMLHRLAQAGVIAVHRGRGITIIDADGLRTRAETIMS